MSIAILSQLSNELQKRIDILEKKNRHSENILKYLELCNIDEKKESIIENNEINTGNNINNNCMNNNDDNNYNNNIVFDSLPPDSKIEDKNVPVENEKSSAACLDDVLSLAREMRARKEKRKVQSNPTISSTTQSITHITSNTSSSAERTNRSSNHNLLRYLCVIFLMYGYIAISLIILCDI